MSIAPINDIYPPNHPNHPNNSTQPNHVYMYQAETPPQSEVQEQLDSIFRQIEAANDISIQMETRLATVLRPKLPPCEDDCAADGPQPQLVELADKLRSISSAIQNITSKYENMIDYIEL